MSHSSARGSAAAMTAFTIALVLPVLAAQSAKQPGPGGLTPPVELTAEQDRARMMELLHISSLPQGADGRNPQADNAANYDESKANPFPNLPDPLTLKNGKKVTTAKMWWDQRRPEI